VSCWKFFQEILHCPTLSCQPTKDKKEEFASQEEEKTVNLPPLASAFLQHTKRQLFYILTAVSL
jgi:hypothetical protein